MEEKMASWEVKKKVREAFEVAIEAEGLPLIPLEWSTRMTRTYGMFKWRNKFDGTVYDQHIVLSDRLARHSLKAAMETMLHELAHYVVRSKYGNRVRPHGHEFHMVNRRLGGSYKGRSADGTRMHVAAERNGRPKRRVRWTCIHGEQAIKTERWNPYGRYFRRCGCSVADSERKIIYI